jgi:hypothetical protein
LVIQPITAMNSGTVSRLNQSISTVARIWDGPIRGGHLADGGGSAGRADTIA